MKFFTLAALITIFCSSPAKALTEQDVEKWREDLIYYKQELEGRHIDLFHTLEREEFEKGIKQIQHQLSRLTEFEVITRLMALTHQIGQGRSDGHTSIPLWNRRLKQYPLEVEIFGSRVLVVKTLPEYKHLLGATLNKLNNTSVTKVVQSFRKIVPFVENTYSERVRVGHKILNVELLRALSFIDNDEKMEFEFKTKNGTKVEMLEPMMDSEFRNASKLELSYRRSTTHEKEYGIGDKIWFSSFHDKQTVYIYFRLYPSMGQMKDFAGRVLDFIKTNRTKNLIIDFRDSFGGNGFVGLKLAEYLVQADTINWKSGVYTLISNKTFSAAMNNSIQFKQLLNAKLVGQPSGARPSGYQDMGQFTLPNSGLLITYSKRRFNFSESDTVALFPDILIPLEESDVIEEYDRVLDWVEKNIKATR